MFYRRYVNEGEEEEETTGPDFVKFMLLLLLFYHLRRRKDQACEAGGDQEVGSRAKPEELEVSRGTVRNQGPGRRGLRVPEDAQVLPARETHADVPRKDRGDGRNDHAAVSTLVAGDGHHGRESGRGRILLHGYSLVQI